MSNPKHLGGVSRRTILKTAGAAGAALAATGLSTPAVFGQNRKQIRFLNAETSMDSIRALKVAAAEYERQTGVEVVIDSVPLGDVFTKVTTSLRSGNPYDIATVAFAGHVLLLANEGHLVDMTPLTSKHEWGKNILFPMDGKTYWYPYDYNLAWIYYRKDLYEENGLEVPKDQATFLANAQALTKDNMSGSILPIASNGATNWLSPGFLWAEGVEVFDDQWNIIIDSAENAPKTKAYLDFFGDLYKTMPSGTSQASYSEMLTSFTSGSVAHSAYAGRLVETVERNAPDLADKFGIFPYMDSSGSGKAVNHGYDGWVVLNTDAAEESMKFMEWFTENQLINFLHTAPLHFQPARLDIYDDPRWKAHPLIEKHAGLVDSMKGFLTDPDMKITSIDTQGPAPDLRPGKVFESFALSEMLQQKCLLGTSSDAALEMGAQKMRDAIA